ANALLGINQGLAWSMTVIMKIDLVGPMRRGLAMGLNEFAGYLALGTAGLVSGIVAAHYGLREGTPLLGFFVALRRLTLSLFVRDTSDHVRLETAWHQEGVLTDRPSLRTILARSIWSDANMFSVSQAGFVNNLNDGLAWGVFPLLFTASGLSLRSMSALAAIYPATWGICQLVTGPMSDRLGRKRPIVAGMLLQAGALVSMTIVSGFTSWAVTLIVLGVGTALVYPTLIAAVGDIAHPTWRGVGGGVYRLWRDLGYVAGALLAGILTDVIGIATVINAIAALTFASGLLVWARFEKR